MKKVLQSISLVLSILLVCTLTACGTSTPDTTSSSPVSNESSTVNAITGLSEPMTIKVLTQKEATELVPYSDLEVFKVLEELTDIHVEFDQPPKTNFQERYNIVMASATLPDVITVMPQNDVVKYSDTGMIIELTDLIDKEMPNFKAFMEKYPEVKAAITNADGKIYGLPSKVYDYPDWNSPIIARADWLEKLNIDVPNNVDDVYEMWKAICNNDPNENGQKDEIGYTARDAKERLRYFVAGFGVLDGFYNNYDTGKVTYGVLEPGYKSAVEWLNKCYNEGLIDPELPSASEAILQSKVAQNIAGTWRGGLRGNFAAYQSTFETEIEGFNLVGIPPLEAPNGKRIHTSRPKYLEKDRCVITATAENPVAIARWLDYAFSEEGIKLFNFGIEGKTYNMINGKPVFTDAITKDPEGRSPFIMQTTYSPISGVAFPMVYHAEAVKQLENTAVTEIREEMNKYKQDCYDYVLPNLNFTIAENEIIQTKMAEITTYVDESLAQFIFSKKPLSEWDKFVANVKKMGIDEIITIYQKAYDATK